MSALSVEPPFPAFAGADGQPLDDGYIWIGTVNLNPITNPIVAYWDAALTITAVQPIRTSGGYPVYQGTPARIYTASDYSIQVQNKNGTVVYTSLNGNAFPGSAGNLVVNATGTGSQTVFAVAFVPSLIYINGVYQNQNTYIFAGGNVTFSEAPPFTSIIEFVF
jgi:formylmethanofuran dehydrogenase subunit D